MENGIGVGRRTGAPIEQEIDRADQVFIEVFYAFPGIGLGLEGFPAFYRKLNAGFLSGRHNFPYTPCNKECCH